VEATGRLHHAWVIELERRWPGSVRLFAPSETQAARTQLGSRRYNSDDRDCAALVWLVRQGAGRPAATDTVDALLGAVGHRRGLVADRKVLQQRLHDQLQALCPGLSAPAGHDRALADPTGQAVLACAAAFAGRPPTVRSLQARAPGQPHQDHRWVLGRPLAAAASPTRRRRAARRAAGPRIWPATGPYRLTSPRWRASWPGCWPPPTGRSSPPCPASPQCERPASPPTACPSTASPPPTTCMRPPVWPQRPGSRPA